MMPPHDCQQGPFLTGEHAWQLIIPNKGNGGHEKEARLSGELMVLDQGCPSLLSRDSGEYLS